MKNLLVISFSELTRDPRVLRQIKLFSENGYRVTTMGHGACPPFAAEHVELPSSMGVSVARKAQVAAQVLVNTPARAYQQWPEVQWALPWIAANRDRFDAVLSNDVIAAPLGLTVGKPLHADLHEYAIGQGRSLRWRLGVLPLLEWAAPLLTRAASTSTVAPGIAAQYLEDLGIDPFVVTNSPNYVPDVEPTETGAPVKLVHMGVGAPERALEMPIKAVSEANRRKPGSVTLDLYLVPGEAAYIESLRKLADMPGTGVTMQSPVAYDQMLPTLRKYDAGIAFYPPLNMNLKHSLPNKFFEAVQARIGFITGPSPAMGPYIHDFGFGATSEEWTQESLNEVVAGLTPQEVDQWKAAANAAAPELGAEHQDKKWLDAINKLVEG